MDETPATTARRWSLALILSLALPLLSHCGGDDTLDAVEPDPASVSIAPAFGSLRFEQSLYVAQAPGDNTRLFVVTQPGLVQVVDVASGTARTFLDIRARVTRDGGEQGLLGLAFDPAYASNGYFYVNYNPNFDTGSNPRRTQISRFKVSADANVANASSETPLLSFNQPGFSNHKGGWLGFGPDSKLYIATGDGGGGGDPSNNAQNLNLLLGKILRINSDGTVPSDNPFVGIDGRRAEIWAYGFRNPYRASFDREGGTFWVADVGQSQREEINRVERGGNYGWRKYEGSLVYNGTDPVPANAQAPLYEYDHSSSGRCSIIGGYVYRGSALPSLRGAYVYADYCSAEVWALSINGGVVTNTALGTVPSQPTSFGEDNAGELYLTAANGQLYRLAAAAR